MEKKNNLLKIRLDHISNHIIFNTSMTYIGCSQTVLNTCKIKFHKNIYHCFNEEFQIKDDFDKVLLEHPPPPPKPIPLVRGAELAKRPWLEKMVLCIHIIYQYRRRSQSVCCLQIICKRHPSKLAFKKQIDSFGLFFFT